MNDKALYIIRLFNASKARVCTLDELGKVISYEMVNVKDVKNDQN